MSTDTHTQYYSENHVFFPLDFERLYGKFVPKRGLIAGANKHVIANQSDATMLHSVYVQPHLNERWRTVYAIDVDSPHVCLEKLRAAGVPDPAAIIGRPATSDDYIASAKRPHLRWNFRIPVRRWVPGMTAKEAKKARKQEHLYNLIRAELIRRIRSCGYKVDACELTTTKNPLSDHWHVIEGNTHQWTLTEFKNVLGIKEQPDDNPELPIKPEDTPDWVRRGRQIFEDAHTKHYRHDYAQLARMCEIFEAIRGPSYARKAYSRSYEDLFAWVMHACEQYNQDNFKRHPKDLLDLGRVRAVAKSISRWTWEKYTAPDDGKDRGVCRREGLINAGMGLKERQSVGAKYTASKKSTATKDRVIAAYDIWMAEGRTINVTALAAELKLDRKTVRKYLPEPPVQTAKPQPRPGGELGVYKDMGHRESLSEPSLRAERDGCVEEYWLRDNDPDHYYDRQGLKAFRHFIDPHVIWRADAEPPPW